MRASTIFLSGLLTGLISAVCIPTAGSDNSMDAHTLSQPNSLQHVAEVWNRIKAEYVDPVEDETLMHGCIAGMAALDPSSAYIAPEEFRVLSAPRGPAGGVGLELTTRALQTVVVAPIDGGPGDRAGVRAGDILLAIDGQPVSGLSLTEIMKRVRGEPGSGITLTLVRGSSQPADVRMQRELLRVPSAHARALEGGVVYLRIVLFSTDAATAVRAAIRNAAGDGRPTGLVVDLRDNSGGVVGAVVDVAKLFIADGTIMALQGRAAHAKQTFAADGNSPWSGVPLVILVNHGTAGGAEILAEALRSGDRATLVGQRTFGQGTIQTILPLGDDSAIKLTTARWATARGQTLDGSGLVPDVEIPQLSSGPDESNSWITQAEQILSRR